MNLPHIPGYEFEELTGEGGCGAVYRCRHGSDYRAVKVLNGLAVNPGLLSHALTTVASLPRHPGLVPVHTYNLGQSPYYWATDFYETEGGPPTTLDGLMGNLPREKAWKVIDQLIEALAFLHKHDVVHTSIKPGNIFIETPPDGSHRVRVSDFGQGLVAGLHYFEMGRSGFYASPEQLTNGDFSHGKGKRWDVYSFGVVTYQLLTGKLPRLNDRYRAYMADGGKSTSPTAAIYEGDPMQYFEALQQEPEISWPSRPKNEYEANLRNVVERCLDLDSSERFVDMRDVARECEEIRHYADVEALQRKHAAEVRSKSIKVGTLIGTTVIFLLASLGLLAAALIGFSQLGVATAKIQNAQKDKSEALALQREAFDQKVAQEEAARIAAEEEARRRQGFADEAQGFLKDALATGDQSLAALLSSSEVDFPGFQEMRRKKLAEAEDFYERFREKFADDPAYAVERFRAHQFLGGIKDSQGRLTEALADYEKAREEAADLDELPARQQAELIMQLAMLDQKVAELHLALGQPDDARKALTASSKKLRDLLGQSNNAELKFKLAENNFRHAEILISQEDWDGAKADLQAVADAVMELRDRQPESAKYKFLLARTFSEIGQIMRREKEMDAAFQMQKQAGELFGELVASNGQIEEYQYHLAVCLIEQGAIKQDKERILDAHQLLDRIVRLNPTDHRYRFELARSFGRLAEIQRNENQGEDALKLNNLAIEVLTELVKEEPTVQKYQFALAAQNVELAQLLGDIENYKDASHRFKQSINVLEELILEDKDNEDYLMERAKTYGHSGYAHQKLGEKDQAKQHYLASIKDWQTLAKNHPNDQDVVAGLEWSQRQLQRLQ